MRIFGFLGMLALGAMMIATPAKAEIVVLDFEEFSGPLLQPLPNPYIEDGFQLVSDGATVETSGANNTVFYAAGETGTLTRADGGLFSLKSIDLRDHFLANALAVTFFALDENSDIVSEVQIPGTFLNTFEFGDDFSRVFGVQWRQGSSGGFFSPDRRHNFDNITVMAIPEPSTWIMMILGFGLVALRLQRKSRAAIATA